MKVYQSFQNTLKFHRSRLFIYQQRRTFIFNNSQEPIKYETKKILPYSQENFYRVISNVKDYQNFVPYMSESNVLENTVQNQLINAKNHGNFDAETKIGFSALSFSYVSHVTYKEPFYVLSESYNSRIFQELYSEWEIKKLAKHQCEVTYKIKMTFTNSIYTSITNQFFEFLTKNINQSFEQRCFEEYYKGKEIDHTEVEEQQIDLKENENIVKEIIGDQSKTDKNDTVVEKVYEDQWIWGLGSTSKLNSRKKMLVKNQTESFQNNWLNLFLQSLQPLITQGLLKTIDMNSLKKTLEQSENLRMEIKIIFDAFGQQEQLKRVYAQHIQRLLMQQVYN